MLRALRVHRTTLPTALYRHVNVLSTPAVVSALSFTRLAHSNARSAVSRRGKGSTDQPSAGAVSIELDGAADAVKVSEGEGGGMFELGMAEVAAGDSGEPLSAPEVAPFRSAQHGLYMPLTRMHTRQAVLPPDWLLKGIDSVLKGRNLIMISEHWKDMMASLEKRNESLHRSVKQMDKLETLWAAGTATDIASDAVSTDSPPLLYGPDESLAYVLHGLLPSYGIALRLFTDVEASTPNFHPKSMLDFGSGPGAAVFAAREVWSGLDDIVVVEPSRSMSQVAEHLLVDSPGVFYRKSLADVTRFHRGKKYDLVVAHYVLSELPTDRDRDLAIAQMWDLVSEGGVLVFSEHGNRWGFRVVKRSRDMLLERAAALARFLPQLKSDRAKLGGGSLALTDDADTDADTAAASSGSSPVYAVTRPSDTTTTSSTASTSSSGALAASVGAVDLASLSMLDFTPYATPPAESHKDTVGVVARATHAMLSLEEGLESGVVAQAAVDKTRGAMSALGVSPRYLPSVSVIKAQLKGFMKKQANALRPPSDMGGMAVVGPCPHAMAVSVTWDAAHGYVCVLTHL